MVAPITRHELGSGEVRPASAVHAGEPGLSGAAASAHHSFPAEPATRHQAPHDRD
jgi:hypothetical protein